MVLLWKRIFFGSEIFTFKAARKMGVAIITVLVLQNITVNVLWFSIWERWSIMDGVNAISTLIISKCWYFCIFLSEFWWSKCGRMESGRLGRSPKSKHLQINEEGKIKISQICVDTLYGCSRATIRR